MPEDHNSWKDGQRRISYEATGIKGLAGDAPWALVAAWITFVAMIACNIAFEVLRFGGVTTAEVSNQVFVWFTPAGYAFAIWTLIYIGLAVWLISTTRDELRFGRNTHLQCLLLCATCALNVLWLALFHLQMIALSLVAIILYWGAVALLYSVVQVPGKSLAQRAPLSLYLGWLSVATVINATNLVTRTMGSVAILNEVSTIALAVIVLGAAIAMTKLAKDYIFPAVVLWAVVAVGVHLVDANPYIAAAIFAMCIISALIAYLPVERLGLRGKVAESSTR